MEQSRPTSDTKTPQKDQPNADAQPAEEKQLKTDTQLADLEPAKKDVQSPENDRSEADEKQDTAVRVEKKHEVQPKEQPPQGKRHKKKSRIKTVCFGVGALIVLFLLIAHALYHEPVDESFLSEYDLFDSYQQVNSDPPVYQVSQDGSTVGYLVLTGHYGYQSEVVMATLVNLDGTVVDARVYHQDESPSYFRKLLGGGFFKRNFFEKSIDQGFSIDTNVDAISNATISSNAATKAIQEGVTYVGEHYLNTDVAQPDNSIKIGYLDALVVIMFILALITTRFSKKKALVWICRLYSIVVMGFLVSQFVTLTVLVAFFSLDWPSVLDYLRWYLLIFGVFILIIGTGKNTYCARMCPFGALQEAIFAFGGSIGKRPLNVRVSHFLRYFPGILVFVSLVLALSFHNLDFANYEPFSLIFGQVGVGVQWALLPLALLGALLSRRIYCNFACPVGYVLTKITIGRNKVSRAIKNKRARKVVTQPSTAAACSANSPATTNTTQPSPSKEIHLSGSTKERSLKGKQALKPYDWAVLCFGLALIVVSLLSILDAASIFGS